MLPLYLSGPPRSPTLWPPYSSGLPTPLAFLLLYLAPLPSSLSESKHAAMVTPVNPDAWRPCQHGEIVDIGGLKSVQSLEQEFVQNLSSGQPLEKSVLYAHSNDWTEASKAQGYYQTYEELAIFDAHSKEILELFSNGMTIIDIGAGSVYQCIQ